MDKEELVQKALKDKLNPAEKAEFELLMQTDEEFQTTYFFEKDVKVAVQQEERSRLKSRLVNRETKPKFKFWHWAAAAMVLFSVSFGAWRFFQPSSQIGLFAQNYEKFPNLAAPNTRAVDNLTTKESAYRAYDRNEYEKAYDLLTELNDQTSNFYAGICLIEMGKFEQATTYFESLSFADEYENHRMWYLSLLYLKQNDTEKAKPILIYLANNQNVWREKADLLLKKI
ncbi:MAG: hypothetical protein NWQ46_06675 [Spirosomaceae bacterium]|nr:hypothetical protein [Spirosomataceae bacterium]